MTQKAGRSCWMEHVRPRRKEEEEEKKITRQALIRFTKVKYAQMLKLADDMYIEVSI